MWRTPLLSRVLPLARSITSIRHLPPSAAFASTHTIGKHRLSEPPWAEPYKIKMVERLKMTTKQQRQEMIAEAGYNTFLLKSEDVYIDLLTDSGTSAMSDRQWSRLMLGDEAYAGASSFYELERTIQEFYGYKYLIPVHQGRAAEHLLSRALIKPGDFIPGNMYFTTTRAHREMMGGTHVDVIIDEAHDPYSLCEFKGNVDMAKLQALVEKVGADKVPYLGLETNVNMAGGQPVSMANIKAVSEYCHSKGIPVYLDATRACENAFFIKMREPGYGDTPVRDILKEICSHTDGCTMSGKKDPLVNIGGWMSTNNKEVYEKVCEEVVVFEGLHTYGGMAGRDMEAMAQGIRECTEDIHLEARIGQVQYLHDLLTSINIPVVVPCGGHAVYLDAKAFLPHMPQTEFPAQALAAALYVESGVRAMERGVVSAGRDPITKENRMPKLELVRLTIPRRVYMQSHMDCVAYGVQELWNRRSSIKGLKFTYEPERLRFFLARFAPVD